MFPIKKIPRTILCLLIVSLFSLPQNSRAEDIRSLGMKTKTKFENCVVTVKLVIKQKMTVRGREMNKTEMKSEITGTVIDPSGLIVVSLTATEPAMFLNKIRGGGVDSDEFRWESEISDIKIRLDNGQEIPAKVVMRDRDFDLAFIQPLENTSKLSAVDLEEDTHPKILDQTIVLTRLGKIAAWTISVTIARIEAIIQKPRIFYVAEQAKITGKLGSPVFSIDSKFIGIIILRTLPTGSDFSFSLFGQPGGAGFIPVILPASDILETSKQILEIKEEKK